MGLFQPFPTTRGHLKILLYGDPGTEKTRRALKMPGPVYVIDMENGASDYGDLVDPGRDKYFATKSHVRAAQAVEEVVALATRNPAAVGTLVVDPVTVVWQSLQAAHIEKVVRKSRAKGDEQAPEDVMFDVGAWGTLKRVYGDFMTNLLNAPFHVVLIARGKELVDQKGNKVGYGYEGEKSTEFLFKTIIETRRDYDLVKKDRTGTFRERSKHPRIDLNQLLGNAGTATSRLETDSEAAAKDARERHPSFKADQKRFMAQLGEMKMRYEHVAALCERMGQPRPSGMTQERRDRLIQWLSTNEGDARYQDFLSAQEGGAKAAK